MNEIQFRNKTVKMGVQTRLGLLIIFTATFIFSGYVLYNYISTRIVMRAELQSLSSFWAKQLTESLKMPLWDFNTASAEGIINSTMLEKQVYAVIVRDHKGKVQYGMTRDSNWNIIRSGENVSGNGYIGKEDIFWKDDIIATVEVCLSPIFMRKKLTEDTVGMLVTIIILDIAIICSLFIGVRTVIVSPLRRIVRSVRIIASGELDTKVSEGRDDEIGQLASDVDKMRLAIKEMTENLKQQERLKKEMELARQIQTSLLPDLRSDLHPDFKIAATMVPAERVGGDFYDISFDKSGVLWLAVGDVSGHGVTPGLIMMMAQTVHTTVTASIDCEARDVVVKVNEILYKNVHGRLKESHFMTFTALKYLGAGQFQHAGAHLSMIVYRQKTGACELIKTRGVYLNFKKDISKATKNAEFSLEPGDILVLYTDGLTEAENRDGKMLDLEGFVKTVEKHSVSEPESMKERIMADVNNWCENIRADDMTLLIVKYKQAA